MLIRKMLTGACAFIDTSGPLVLCSYLLRLGICFEMEAVACVLEKKHGNMNANLYCITRHAAYSLLFVTIFINEPL